VTNGFVVLPYASLYDPKRSPHQSLEMLVVVVGLNLFVFGEAKNQGGVAARCTRQICRCS